MTSAQLTRTCSHPDGCDRRHFGNGWCRAHYQRVYTSGDPGPAAIALPPTKGVTGHQHPAWKGGDVAYRSAHSRVATARGPASAHPCAELCGAAASSWAYDHLDPNELTTTIRDFEAKYSVDPAHYRPLCRSCHTRVDRHRGQT